MVNMNQIMKQAQVMQKKMLEAQEKIAQEEFIGHSGAGAVTITLNGKSELKKVKIDPAIVDKEDVEMLEDLIIAAFNEAKQKVDNASEGGMSSLLGGMKLPF